MLLTFKWLNKKRLLPVSIGMLLVIVPLVSLAQHSKTEDLEKQLEAHLPDSTRIRLLNELAFAIKGEVPEKAGEYAEEAIHLSQTHNDLPGQANGWKNLGLSVYYLGRPQEAISHFQRALVLFQTLGYSSDIAYCSNALGIFHNDLAKYDSSLSYVRIALRMYQRLENAEKISDAINNIGLAFFHMGIYDSAAHYYRLSIATNPKTGGEQGLALGYNNLANVFLRQGNQDSALHWYLTALDLAETSENQRSIALITGNIGSILLAQSKFQEALVYFEKNLAMSQSMHDPQGLLVPTLNIGNCWLQLKAYQKADSCFKEVIFLARAQGNLKFLAFANNALGISFFEQGNIQEAITTLDQAIELAEEVGVREIWIEALNARSRIYSQNGQYEKALGLFQKGLELSLEMGVPQKITQSYLYLSESYADQGKFEEALNYHRLYQDWRDSMMNIARMEQLTRMEKQYQSEKKQAEIDLLTKDNEIKDLNVRQQRQFRILTLIIASFVLLLVLALFYRYRLIQERRRRETELDLRLQEVEAENLREMNQLKSRFFANISHELRTPLTLILGPLSRFLTGKEVDQPHSLYLMMQRNAHRLLNLVNQLLDLSSLEAGRMRANFETGDISALIRGIAHSFESLAEEKQIQYSISIPTSEGLASFDQDKLEKILNNLLGNAFKYTPEGGRVGLSAELEEKSIGEKPKQNELILTIEDNGIGISEDQLPYIFDRFYQVESGKFEGSGLGLALVKELVDILEGEIQVRSQEGKGSIFVVRLPLLGPSTVQRGPMEVQLAKPFFEKEEVVQTPNPNEKADHIIKVLIVEDNADVRTFIRSSLPDEYEILEAENGSTGLTVARQELPDLIVSDLMMPEMDGMLFTQEIKAHELTSHIPIIMLTAKAAMDSKIEGLQTGADDYLIKPFHEQELQVRIQNLIRQRQQLREKYRREISLKPLGVEPISLDEQFLQKVLASIEANISETTYGVDQLSEDVAMSRGHLHRKLNALTGQNPSELIRSFRLDRAKELLQKGAGTAAEISFLTGFNSPSYFSKAFKKKFGHSPSALKGEI